MLLFAAALVVGQTRAEQASAARTLPLVSTSTSPGSAGLLYQNDKARLVSIRRFVDTVSPNSGPVELTKVAIDYPVDDEIATGTGLPE